MGYSCRMATIDGVQKFAEQALQIERVLDKHNVTGNPGRVVFILAAAAKIEGVTQKRIVERTALPNDVVSKLVGSLVRGGLLTQKREGSNSLIKRLSATASGRALLSRMVAVLQPPRPVKQQPKQGYSRMNIFGEEVAI